MVLVNVTGFEVTAKFDTSLPSSYISPKLAFLLPSLENVSVSTVIDNDGSFFSTSITFTVYEKLMTDCVLGVDFFTRVSESHGALIFHF